MQRRARSSVLILAAFGSALLWGAGARALGDDEIDKHLEMLRSQMEDSALTIERREQVALEMAATLDRAARGAAAPDEKRRRWTEAATLLDAFDRDHPGHPQAREFRFEAAVFVWARGKLRADQWELAPRGDAARKQAAESLDDAIGRLGALRREQTGAEDVLAQNVRFRLAQALCDRAELEPDGSVEARKRLEEAAGLLEQPVSEPSLKGFAGLLRAEVLSRLGDGEKAAAAVEDAARAAPPPSEAELLSARVSALTARKQFDEAIAAVDRAGAGVPAPLKGLLRVRVRRAQRRSLGPGSSRSQAESALFRAAEPLRGSRDPDARLALLALARGVAEPEPAQPPEAWDVLAEGALALGEPERAGKLESGGARRADELKQPELAASLRLRAGAALFQAGKFVEADPILTRVVGDPRAGAVRPRAALLRALARGRALALKLAGATPAGYVEALDAMIRDVPDDPGSNEARWLLGKVKLARSDREGAQTLWADIARTDPRWLDARLAVAELRQEDLDTQRINNDRDLVAKRYGEARTFLDATRSQCTTDAERAAVDLALARLELTPEAGQPEQARKLCEAIQRSASRAPQRDRARRLRIVAVAEMNHFIEAEREARDEVRRSGLPELLDLARMLDQAASATQSDLRMRRFGLLLRIVLAPVMEHQDELAPAERAEAHLRQARALLLSGDDARARAALTSAPAMPGSFSDRLLRDLADAYERLGAYELAASVQRLRLQRASNGSLTWFEARYGLALAYYRAGKVRDAARLVDATAILHPDLGGGELREKFVHLRQRLNVEQ